MKLKENPGLAANSPAKKTTLPSTLFQYGALALVTLLSGAQGKKEGFDASDLAEELAPYAEGMEPSVKASFEEVLALMGTDLKGITIEKSTFEDDPNARASASIPRKYEETSPLTVTLNTNWDASNGLDRALLVHELDHIVRVEGERKTEDKVSWTKRFGHTSATEIRTELEAWELHFTLMDKESNGLMSELYEQLNKAEPEQVDTLLDTYLEKISVALNVREDQKKVLKSMLKIYVNYRLQKDELNCPWSYKFATDVASHYSKAGLPLYELDLNTADEGPDPSHCLYPLPSGNYEYRSYRPYEDRGDGVIGPRAEAVHFEF